MLHGKNSTRQRLEIDFDRPSRVETRKRWGLIDQDIEHIRPAFQVADTGEELDKEDGSDVAG